MSLGFCLGKLYSKEFPAKLRRKILLLIGSGCVLLFISLRMINNYGEPEQWRQYPSILFSFMSFINTTKYPPSLLYLLMTIGPSLIFLSLSETFKNKIAQFLIVFGRVPFFFYLLHLAAFITTLFSYSWNETVQSLKTMP